MAAEKKIKFEDALTELEDIVAKLEDDTTGLDESFALFEKGSKLAKVCADKLTGYERQVKIVKTGGGKSAESARLELFEDEGKE
ncbi:MAG: exodeoxyribonuclease VII small subunit [Spirochaetes bacterium]|nr:exodeoxyribonuclease VII small subunit [Spirochaetota bacterium]